MTRIHCGSHYYNIYYIRILYEIGQRERETRHGERKETGLRGEPGVIIRRHCSTRQLGRAVSKCQTDRGIHVSR